MRRIKSLLGLMLVFVQLCIILSGCSGTQTPSEQAHDSLSVYATFSPLYALADMIVHDVPDVELYCLVQPQDGCLRAYSISDWDIALLASSADIVIAGGNGLESFEDLLYAFGEQGPGVAAVLHDMPLTGQAAANVLSDEDSHWSGDNPHIYMSIDGATEICSRIASAMSVLDEAHRENYAANLRTATDKLAELDDELQNKLANMQDTKVIVMNESLVYAAREYGMNISMCYARESGEEMQDFEIEACLETLSNADTKLILIEKQAPQSLCRSLEDAGYFLVKMDTLSTRRADEGFEAYFDAQRENASALIDALKSANSQS